MSRAVACSMITVAALCVLVHIVLGEGVGYLIGAAVGAMLTQWCNEAYR